MRRRPRAGSALLEVIAALTILVLGAVAGGSLLAHLSHALATAQHADRETAAAADVLSRMSLWSRARLEQAIGENEIAGFAVTVQRLTSTLYYVEVARPLHRAIIVGSVLYRAEDPSASARS